MIAQCESPTSGLSCTSGGPRSWPGRAGADAVIPMGVLRIQTDEGDRGQQLPQLPGPGPGDDRRADRHALLKPRPRRARPARHRRRSGAAMQRVSRLGRPDRDRRRRRRPLGHRRQGRRPAGPPAARDVPRPGARLLLVRAPRPRARTTPTRRCTGASGAGRATSCTRRRAILGASHGLRSTPTSRPAPQCARRSATG